VCHRQWSNSLYNGPDPAVANGIIYIGSGYNSVYALNATNGIQLWSYPTGSGIDSSPAVVDDVVFIGSTDHNLYALNATNGAKLWSFTAQYQIDTSAAVDNDVVYVGSGQGGIAKIGPPQWLTTFSNGTFYALNASTGAEIWGFTADSMFSSSPAVVGSTVYIGSFAGTIYALNTTNGNELWHYTTGGAVSSPAVVNGVLYTGSGDGKVYALGSPIPPATVSPSTAPSHSLATSKTLPIIAGVAMVVFIVIVVFLILQRRRKSGSQTLTDTLSDKIPHEKQKIIC